MRALPWILLGFTTAAYTGQASEPYPVVLSAEKAELARSMEQLKKQEVAPYFLSYEIVETHTATVIGSFMLARGFFAAHSRCTTATMAISSWVMPWVFM